RPDHRRGHLRPGSDPLPSVNRQPALPGFNHFRDFNACYRTGTATAPHLESGGPPRSGSYLPQMPPEGAPTTLPVGRGPCGGPRALAPRRAHRGPAGGLDGAYSQVGPAQTGGGGIGRGGPGGGAALTDRGGQLHPPSPDGQSTTGRHQSPTGG